MKKVKIKDIDNYIYNKAKKVYNRTLESLDPQNTKERVYASQVIIRHLYGHPYYLSQKELKKALCAHATVLGRKQLELIIANKLLNNPALESFDGKVLDAFQNTHLDRTGIILAIKNVCESVARKENLIARKLFIAVMPQSSTILKYSEFLRVTEYKSIPSHRNSLEEYRKENPTFTDAVAGILDTLITIK